MGVVLYRDMLEWIDRELRRCTCVDVLLGPKEPYEKANFLAHRINLLERREELELKTLRQLGWA